MSVVNNFMLLSIVQCWLFPVFFISTGQVVNLWADYNKLLFTCWSWG